MPFPKSPSLVVFDKDGVLVDLNSWIPLVVGIAEYLVERGAALGDNSLQRDALLRVVGVEMRPGSDDGVIVANSIFASGTFIAMREAWQTMAPSLAPVFSDLETYRSDIQRIREERMHGKTIPKGEVAATLSRLKDAGWTLAIATNDTVNSTRINLDHLEIAGAFDTVVCADSGFGRKPDPDGLLEVCRVTGFPPERSVMVGDTRTDWLAAQNAGFGSFIAIADSAPKRPEGIDFADAVLQNVGELLGLLAGTRKGAA